LRAIAREAGAAILEVYHSDFAVDHKADKSPVTEADRRSERLILDRLAVLTPRIPAVSEEADSRGDVVDISGGRFWLIDPLDGTKEFARRNGEFTVNIGLVVDGVPVVGVLFAPVIDRLFAAAPGLVTVEDGGAAARPIACRRWPEEGLVVLSSRSHRDPARFDAFIGRFPVAEIRHSGSALKFGLVAAGEADLYPRFGPTMEWDTAAGHALLNAAGGCLTLPDGSPLAYGKPGFANPSVIAWGTPTPQV
jgi:3'(2'), 5'-bisphosphate nucleotidase